jgi:hypothetical protein
MRSGNDFTVEGELWLQKRQGRILHLRYWRASKILPFEALFCIPFLTF